MPGVSVAIETGPVRAALEAAAPGTELFVETTVDHRRKQARARTTKLPFFDPERKRK